jgi:hypothetical protein
MRGAFLLSTLILTIASTAFAQGGAICLFTDDSGAGCPIRDDTPGLLQVYVIHTDALGVTGSSFAVPKPACMTGVTWLNDTQIFPVTVGNSQDGVAIGYGACLHGSNHVLTINYSASGHSENNCAYPVLPYPGDPFVTTIDCNDNELIAGAGISYVNSEFACECEAYPLPPMLDVSTGPSGSFSLYFEGGTDELTFDILNLGDSTLVWSLETDQPWLDALPASGEDDETIAVTVDRTGMAEGNHFGAIDVQSNGGNKQIDVVMFVPSLAVLSVSPMEFDFGATGIQDTLEISNVGEGTLVWSARSGYPWLSVSPQSGTEDGAAIVTVEREGLTTGIHSGGVFVNSNGGSYFIHVSLEVAGQGPELSVTPASLDFDELLSERTLYIRNLGAPTLSWVITPEADWITSTPPAGTGDANVSVTVDRSTLSTGVHHGFLSIVSNGGTAQTQVRVVVPAPPTEPWLSVTPITLSFAASETEKTFEVANIGAGTLEWTVSEDQEWMTVAPLSGTQDGTITVTIDRSVMPEGSQTGVVHVASNGGDATVTVEAINGIVLSVSPTELVFDSPADNPATVAISNVGTGTLEWSLVSNADWLTVNPTSGTGGGQVHVTADLCAIPSAMPSFANIAVVSNGGAETIAVVAVPSPEFAVTPNWIQFAGQEPQAYEVNVWAACPDTSSWTAAADSAWVSVEPPSGVGSGTVLVIVTPPQWWLDSSVEGYTYVRFVSSRGEIAVLEIQIGYSEGLPTKASSWGRMKSRFKSE